MRVLQVNKHYAPVVGGIERAVQTTAEGLAADHDVRVLASRRRGWGSREIRGGVRVRKTPSVGVLLSVPLAPTFPAELRAAARPVDLVHHHLPNPLGSVSQLVAGPDTPIVATYHSDIVRQARALSAYEPVLDRFLAACDRILVTSPPLLENSPHLAPHGDRCTVVPLSVDVEAVTEPAPAPFETEGAVVLTVGRLNYYKGAEHLVAAMPGVDATLVVVGDGPRRGELERQAATLGVADRVHFPGKVSDSELRGAYQAADVFVLPSVARSEAFGLVQLEAMANGVPVVNTDLPTGVPWVSRDGETGLTVPPGSPDALAEAITTLLADPERRRRYGRNARARVEAEFDRATMLARVESVYESVVAGRPPSDDAASG